jgi:hypothetical protein
VMQAASVAKGRADKMASFQITAVPFDHGGVIRGRYPPYLPDHRSRRPEQHDQA